LPHQLAEGGLLVALARGQHERHRPAPPVAADVQLAAEAAARAAQRLTEPPPFAPAAQRCARTLVPSTMCTSQSISPFASAKRRNSARRRFHSPDRVQR